jgi:hypothetical protein
VEPLSELEKLGDRRPDVDRKDRGTDGPTCEEKGNGPGAIAARKQHEIAGLDAKGCEQVLILLTAVVEVGCRERPIRGRQIDEGSLRIAAADADEPVDDGLHEPESIL